MQKLLLNSKAQFMITFEEMTKIVAETMDCAPEKVTLETHLIEDLEADSLDAMELNMALEDAFGVSISDEELVNLKTVGGIYQAISALVQTKS